MKETGFDTQKYLNSQSERIYNALTNNSDRPSFWSLVESHLQTIMLLELCQDMILNVKLKF
jgi:hypothetical protein